MARSTLGVMSLSLPHPFCIIVPPGTHALLAFENSLGSIWYIIGLGSIAD
jgi:hypothetical protein